MCVAYWEGVERSSEEHNLEDNTQHRVLWLATADTTQITQTHNRQTQRWSKQNLSITSVYYKITTTFFRISMPLYSTWAVTSILNCFPSLTSSHYDLACLCL